MHIQCSYTISQESDLLKVVDEAWEEAWQIANSTDGWKEEKTSKAGDIVVSKKNKKGG